MSQSVFEAGRTAVVTGAASGIGLAACRRLAGLGMHVSMIDLDVAALKEAATEVIALAPGGAEAVRTFACDISADGALREIKDTLDGDAVDVALLFNNAVIRDKAGPWDGIETWRHMLDVNFFAVLAAVEAFAPDMIASGRSGMIVNAGSKQGITSPPGNAPYNVAKSALKTYTELLQHDLRNTANCRVSAHLLIPGMTTTGTRPHRPGAWMPDQVIDYMMPALERGDFYILCPDDEVTPAMDRKRVLWAAGDIVDNRPPLSRWEPYWAEVFKNAED